MPPLAREGSPGPLRVKKWALAGFQAFWAVPGRRPVFRGNTPGGGGVLLAARRGPAAPMTQRHPTDTTAGETARVASDLTPGEDGVAAWFQGLPRPEAPAALRRQILERSAAARVSAAEGAIREGAGAGRLLRMFPLGAWGVATAALVLVALGAAVAVEVLDPVTPAPTPHARQAVSPASSLVLVEDPTMALFHDLATFDEVGRAPGELIADWQR